MADPVKETEELKTTLIYLQGVGLFYQLTVAYINTNYTGGSDHEDMRFMSSHVRSTCIEHNLPSKKQIRNTSSSCLL